MARQYGVSGERGVLAGRQGRTLLLILIVLAVLVIAGGAALAFGFTTKTKPLNAAITAELIISLTTPAPAVSRVELTDCEPLETEEMAATTPSR